MKNASLHTFPFNYNLIIFSAQLCRYEFIDPNESHSSLKLHAINNESNIDGYWHNFIMRAGILVLTPLRAIINEMLPIVLRVVVVAMASVCKFELHIKF